MPAPNRRIGVSAQIPNFLQSNVEECSYITPMDRPDVQALHGLSKAVVAADNHEAVRELLTSYEAGEIRFEELVSAVQALGELGSGWRGREIRPSPILRSFPTR